MTTCLPIIGNAFLALLTVAMSVNAGATTYFVDALNGKDTFAGTVPITSGSNAQNGPWQTLARVARAGLAPGDTVQLHCDQKWHETLTLNVDGTLAAPIVLGRYPPTTCSANPIISGGVAIPSYAWTRQIGNIYQVRLPANLVKATDATAGFRATSTKRNHKLVADKGCTTPTSVCVSVTSGTSATTATSGTFPVTKGGRLNVSYRARLPAKVVVKAVIRRAVAPFDIIGASRTITGTGGFQTFTYQSVSNAATSSARIEFTVPATSRKLSIANLRVTQTFNQPLQVLDGGVTLAPAHHPNRGFGNAADNRLFASLGANSDRLQTSDGVVSTFLTPGADFVLPSGGALTPGLGVVVRTTDWLIDEMKIASVQNGNIFFDRPSTFQLDKDWGFYVLGARWMLDSPGEWYFDPTTSLLTVWMRDNLAPGSRVNMADTGSGLDLSAASNVTVDGIDLRSFKQSLVLRGGQNLIYRNGTITNSGEYAVDAVRCVDCEISGSTLTHSGRDAISATTLDGLTATRLRVLDNRISNSGVSGAIPGPLDLPIRSLGAVRAGSDARVENNTVTNSGYIGILVSVRSNVVGNRVENSCLILNDCSGIYTAGVDNHSTIDHNTVITVVGNLDGVPTFMTTLTAALYLDELAEGVSVTANTLIGADDGIHIHNAFNNTISGNTFYGHHRYQLWAQEGSNHVNPPAGDLHDNQITGNRFFPSVPQTAIQHETVFASTASFATYSLNLYSTLLSKTVASELSTSGSAAFELPEWKSVRNQDLNATAVDNVGFATFKVTDLNFNNLVPNGDLANIVNLRWSHSSDPPPPGTPAGTPGTLTVELCPQGHCLHYVAGTFRGRVTSPNFSVAKDQWYRVAFDAKTATDGQPIQATARRGGGGANRFENLAPGSFTFTGSTNWKRYTFTFQAAKTVNAADLVTGDNGARVDFEHIDPGTAISIGKLEMLPLSPIETALKTRVLINSSAAALDLVCPDQATDSDLCNHFVKFSDNQPITFPYTLPAHSSEVIFSRDATLTDSDGDGVPTSQDDCAATTAGESSNAHGCSFSQSP